MNNMRNKPFLSSLIIFIVLAGCLDNPYRQGKDIYNFHCAGCHSEDGSGLAHLIPALDTAKLKLGNPQKLVCLIRNGLPRDSLTQQQMPANTSITETEMTNLINYLGVWFLHKHQLVKAAEIQQMYAACQSGKAPK